MMSRWVGLNSAMKQHTTLHGRFILRFVMTVVGPSYENEKYGVHKDQAFYLVHSELN